MEENIFSINKEEENTSNTDNTSNSEILNIDLPLNESLPKKKSMFSFLGGKKNKKDFSNDTKIDDNIGISGKQDIFETQQKSNSGDIFQDLDLGGIDFIEDVNNNFKKPFNSLVFTKQISSFLVIIVFFGVSIFGVNEIVIGTNNDFIKGIPGVCEYIGSKIIDFDNSSCLSIDNILKEKKKKYYDLEDSLYKNLLILIPKKIQTDYIISSPEVKFIQEKHSNEKIFINKIFEDFELIRTTNKPFDGYNIECSNFIVDESGIISINCDFFGASITNIGNNLELKTSRTVVLDFLDRLNSDTTHFKVLEYPKNLSISPSSNIEGIKSRFTTQTNVTLKLQYFLDSKF